MKNLSVLLLSIIITSNSAWTMDNELENDWYNIEKTDNKSMEQTKSKRSTKKELETTILTLLAEAQEKEKSVLQIIGERDTAIQEVQKLKNEIEDRKTELDDLKKTNTTLSTENKDHALEINRLTTIANLAQSFRNNQAQNQPKSSKIKVTIRRFFSTCFPFIDNQDNLVELTDKDQ